MNITPRYLAADPTGRVFTVIGSFRGIPFTTQFKAETPEGAVRAWLDNFPLRGFAKDLRLQPGEEEKIRHELAVAVPRPDRDFRSMWSIVFVVEREPFSLDLVDTK